MNQPMGLDLDSVVERLHRLAICAYIDFLCPTPHDDAEILRLSKSAALLFAFGAGLNESLSSRRRRTPTPAILRPDVQAAWLRYKSGQLTLSNDVASEFQQFFNDLKAQARIVLSRLEPFRSATPTPELIDEALITAWREMTTSV